MTDQADSVIAYRDLRCDGHETRVSFFAPKPSHFDGEGAPLSYSCSFSFASSHPRLTDSNPAFGIDGVQALNLAMVKANLELQHSVTDVRFLGMPGTGLPDTTATSTDE